jgi:hypothetical protein
MAENRKARARVVLPLSRGSVQPVDVGAHKGLRLDLRGSGPYIVRIITLAGSWSARIEGGADWRHTEVPFTSFSADWQPSSGPATWKGDDLLQVTIELTRPAGAPSWLELDNLAFY